MSAPSRIRVTADHIARGIPQNSGHCPIALAIREQYGIDCEVDALPGIGAIFRGAVILAAELPRTADEFMQAFDDSEPVEPFEFTVEWIDQDGGAA